MKLTLGTVHKVTGFCTLSEACGRRLHPIENMKGAPNKEITKLTDQILTLREKFKL